MKRWLWMAVLVSASGAAYSQCDPIDFNNDGLFPDTQDQDDFLSVFSGGPCSTGDCSDIDFNNDGVYPDTADVDAFLRVFSGGPCRVADMGWTAIPAKWPESRDFYVADSGSESNSGDDAQHPQRRWATVRARLRSGFGDRVHVVGDLTLDDVNGASLYHLSGAAASQPIIIMGDTPDGRRPVVTRRGTDAAFYFGGSTAYHLWMVNLDVRGDGAAYGLQSYVTGGDWLVEGCSFAGFSTGVNLNGSVDGVRFRRCVFADNQSTTSHSQGVYIEQVRNVTFDGCVWDHNGRGYADDGGTMFNHNLYVNATCTGVTVMDSISARPSATALQMRWNRQYALRNLIIDAPLGITFGHDSKASAWPTERVSGSMLGNWIQGTADIAPDQPRGGPALGFGYADGVTISGNYIVNGPTAREAAIRTDRPSRNVTVTGNTVINWAGGEYAEASTAIPRDASNAIDTTPAFAPRTTAPTVADYLRHYKVVPATTARFLELARANRKGAWDERWTARSFIEWARAQ